MYVIETMRKREVNVVRSFWKEEKEEIGGPFRGGN
jgi:hypothetical protein